MATSKFDDWTLHRALPHADISDWHNFLFVSSDRSSCSDDGLLYIYLYIQGHFFRFSLSPLMQLMLQVGKNLKQRTIGKTDIL